MPTTDLLTRLQAFAIDDGTPLLTFEARLARENGWTLAYARRVVAEYRRFLYLAVTAGHTVTPSEDVDQAWHLHLTYTRSYWGHLCGEILGQPLHHGPTRGGAEESAKFLGLYEQTRASYRAAFGEEPPADIWPPSAERFGDDLHWQRVNTAEHWVLSKGKVRRCVVGTVFGVSAIVFASGCNEALHNPFALVGKEFFGLLIPALAVAFLVGRLLRRWACGPGPRPGGEPELTWEATAYLAGGTERLTTTTVARLVAAGKVNIAADGKTLVKAAGASGANLTPVEQALWDCLPLDREDRQAQRHMQQCVETAALDVREHVAEQQYVMSIGQQLWAACVAFLPLALVVLFLALPRLVLGVWNEKPVGLLIVATVGSVVFGLIVSLLPLQPLTRRGGNVLKQLRQTHQPTAAAPGLDALGMSVALFGTLALTSNTSLAGLDAWFPKHTASSSDGGGSGCGGGGCGGGCGGCGGCGG